MNGSLWKFTYNNWCAITKLEDPINSVEPDFRHSVVKPRIYDMCLQEKCAYTTDEFFDMFKHIWNDQFDDTMMVKLANLSFIECVLLDRD